MKKVVKLMYNNHVINRKAGINSFYVTVILSLFPFIQNSYQLFIPAINYLMLIWKILILVYYVAFPFFREKRIDKLLLVTFLCNLYMIIPTFLHNGSYTKFFGYFIDSAGLLFVIRNLFIRNSIGALQGVKYFCRIMLYLNFILLVIFPNGVFVEDNGYMATRYLFLGLDNQAAILLITFMIIIFAIEKLLNSKIHNMFWVDLLVFLISTILIWCGTEIIGIFVYIIVFFSQKKMKRKLTINSCIYVLFALFIFVVILHGFDLFSILIVSFLGKDMTLSGRTMIWSGGIQEWLKYPLLGHGYQISEAFITFSNIQGYARGAHNQVLNFMLHGGVFFVLCYVAVFKTVHKAVEPFKNISFINILTIGLLINFVMWTADTYGHLVGMYILIGLLYYGRKVFDKERI